MPQFTDDASSPFATDEELAEAIEGLTTTGVEEAVDEAVAEAIPFVNVKSYGALGDGATDDTAAIQAAITAAGVAGGSIIYLPAGTYRITSTLNVTGSRVVIKGEGILSSRIHLASATATAITASGSQSGLAIEDLLITSYSDANTRTAGSSISVVNYGDVRIKNCWLRCGWNAISLDPAYTVQIKDVVIDDLSTVTGGGLNTGITVDGGSISTRIEDTYIAATNSAAAVTAVSVESGTDTFVARGVEIIGSWDYGFRIRNVGSSFDPRWIRLTDCFVEPDNTTGNAVELGACQDVELKGVYTAYGQYGIHLSSASCKNVRIIGGIVQLAQKYGILLDNCVETYISGTLVTDNSQAANNTYSGIAVAPGITQFRIDNVRAGNVVWNGTGGFGAYQKYGVEILSGASDNYSVINCDLRSNVTGGFLNAGTGATQEIRGNFGVTALPTVTAAATTTLPGGETISVTGNTNITAVTASYVGRRATLVFTGTPTFTDGSNLKLSANLVATADDTITIVCDGTNWYETGRSVN